jgi:hypothetical protein
MRRAALFLGAIACLCPILFSCAERDEAPAAGEPAGQTMPAATAAETPADSSAATPEATVAPMARQAVPTQRVITSPTPATAAASDEPLSVNVDIAAEYPVMPPRGNVSAAAIDSANQLVPGLFADGYIGDYLLENDLLKMIVSRPGRDVQGGAPGGSIIDVVHKKFPMDYMNYMLTLPDLEGTQTQIVYTRADEPRVDESTTGVLVIHGHLGKRMLDEPDTAPLHRVEGVDVTTTFSVPKDKPYVEVVTGFRNNTSNPLEVEPVDVIDWGEANVFIEGIGYPQGPNNAPARWIAGTMDDTSVGYVAGPGRKFTGIHSQQFSILRGAGEDPISMEAPTALEPVEARAGVPRATPTPTPFIPPRFRGTLTAPATTETVTTAPAEPESGAPFAPPIPGLRLPETEYAPSRMPAPGTESPMNPPVTQPATRLDPPRKEPLGGAAPNEDRDAAAEAPVKSRVTLPPGGVFTFTRFIVATDRDLDRIGRVAHMQTKETTGALAGIVLEQGTYSPVANAEIRISGGPGWQPDQAPRAYSRTMTRGDGTFAVHLPPGNYYVIPYAPGRAAAVQDAVTKVGASAAPVLLPLTVSTPAILRIGVSAAETATSEPLPCKVTFQAKPGTNPMNWGITGDITQGVRNVYYLPYGAGEIPVDPGRYQITISRGIEYDIVQRDITIEMGRPEEVLVSLPKSLKTPAGMIAMDAGVMTTASAMAAVTPRDRIMMAACEGVPVIISGDIDAATDLQPEIERYGFQNHLKAFAGMRFLTAKDDFAANILVYPVTGDTAGKLLEFQRQAAGVPPDVFLADLRRQFPDIVIQIDEPVHPERGYLNAFEFDDNKEEFVDGVVPPPDFDAIQVMPGNKVAMERMLSHRYYAIALARSQMPAGAAQLTPMGSSAGRLPFHEEVGYPRAYIYTSHDTIERLLPEDITRAVKGQHVTVTNGPLVLFWAFNPRTQRFDRMAGDVADYATTGLLTTKLNILAAPWVAVNGFRITMNGVPQQVREVRPVSDLVRYPVHQLPNADVQNIYIQGDVLISALAFASRSLGPVVPDNPPEFGGPVMPRAWSAPIFIDANGDGRIQAQRPKIEMPTPTPGQEPAPLD